MRRHLVHAVQREEGLGIERVLDPQRAVLIEGGDALLRRHERGAAAVGRGFDKVQDCLLRRSLIPGRKDARSGLRRRHGGRELASENAKRRQHRKHGAAVQL